MPHHSIELFLGDGGLVSAGSAPEIAVGDTLSFSSPDGKAHVQFQPSGHFSAAEFDEESKPVVVRAEGSFEMFFALTLPDGQRRGSGLLGGNNDSFLRGTISAAQGGGGGGGNGNNNNPIVGGGNG